MTREQETGIKKINTVDVGSRVFVNAVGSLCEYEVIAIRITNFCGELRGEVEAKMVKTDNKLGNPLKFSLEQFITGIYEAQDMKISDIRRE